MRVVALDDEFADIEIAGLKVDVEGAEHAVLDGAEHLLSQQKVRLIQLEWNSVSRLNFGETRAPLVELLERAGYVLMRPDAEGLLNIPVRLDDGSDVFAFPSDRLAALR